MDARFAALVETLAPRLVRPVPRPARRSDHPNAETGCHRAESRPPAIERPTPFASFLSGITVLLLAIRSKSPLSGSRVFASAETIP